ncbi:hypothetical protein FACS189493_6750 [Spirochaetia bacterium]|nr:hypothetical protein FACS189493_6750 [Spirochaetia bacterium]
MTSSYPQVCLGDIASITKLAGFEFTKYIKYNDSGDIIALRALNIRNGKLDLSHIQKIDKKTSDLLPRSKLNKNDIIFTYTGNGYGDATIITENDKFHLAPNIAKITPIRVDPYYLFKYIKSDEFYQQVKNHIVGSSQPTIPMKIIRQLLIPIPPMIQQCSIAATLSCLDDKIELNKRINANLEAQAQAIFKSWFVDFEPFQNGEFVDSELGKIPKGWKAGTLGDICRYSAKRIAVNSLTKENYISTENMLPNRAGYTKATNLPTLAQTTMFNAGNVLISNIRPYFKKLVYCDSIGGCSTDVLCLDPCSPQISAFLFYAVYTDAFFDYMVAGAKGTKMPRGDKDHIMNYPIVIPPNDKILRFNNIVNPILTLKSNFVLEKIRLANIRDTLLPRLMSGEIGVGDL